MSVLNTYIKGELVCVGIAGIGDKTVGPVVLKCGMEYPQVKGNFLVRYPHYPGTPASDLLTTGIRFLNPKLIFWPQSSLSRCVAPASNCLENGPGFEKCWKVVFHQNRRNPSF